MKTTNFKPGWAIFVETQKGRFFIESGIGYYGNAKERCHDMAIKAQSRTICCNQWFITDRPGSYCNEGGREEFEAAYPDLLEGAKLGIEITRCACGGKTAKILDNNGAYFWVNCGKCCRSGPRSYSPQSAADEWTRFNKTREEVKA